MNALLDPLRPLRDYVVAMTELVSRTQDEATLLSAGRALLAGLIAEDAWLPDACAKPSAERYQQYLLHCDPLERFSVTSFVWAPGQTTPVHDHTVWGLVGVLRGAELGERYVADASGRLVAQGAERFGPGDIDAVSPTLGDIHTVSNALADAVTVSIHVYGANIGAVRRHVFDAATGARKMFVSGYSSAQVPNLWDRSASVREAG